ASYAALVALIEAAQQRIDLCFFIFHPDRVGQDILQHLIRRAEEGVRVHLLLDGVGSLQTRERFLKPLLEAGGHIAFFNPVLHRPLRGHTNLRNHRKLAIADDSRVLAGGANIASEYMGPESEPERWRDLTFIIEGPVVARFVELFRADWRYASGQEPGRRSAHTMAPACRSGQARLQVVPSGPDMPGDALYDVLLTAIFGARQRLWLVTPYFIPDDALCRAIILAVHRGVDVRILLPKQSNHRLADIAGRSYLREIQQEGGRVLLYGQGMVHAKAVVADEELAILGSANTDMRSLLLNYEVGVLVTSQTEVKQVSRWLEKLMQGCEEGVEDVSAIGDMGEGLARLLAPQL
ncbi:MAG TPA: cardiolipin synthase, partial [Gammaproteobacteria bacterium]|nr:cardiolipin synthase [Gammaproteobacteria bacterium]